MKKKESEKDASGHANFRKQVEAAVRDVLKDLEKDEYSVTIAGDTITIKTDGDPSLTIFMPDNEPSLEEVIRIRKDNMTVTEEEDGSNAIIVTQSMWTSVQEEIVRQIRQLALPEELDIIYIDDCDSDVTFRTECITRDEYEEFISGKSQKPAEIPGRHRMIYLAARKNDDSTIVAAVALCVGNESFGGTDILASGYVTSQQFMRTRETLDDMLNSLFSNDCDNMDDCVMEVFGGMFSHELTLTLVQDARLYGAFADAEEYDEDECEEEEDISDVRNEDGTYIHEYDSPWYIDDRIIESSEYPAMALMCPYHYNQYAYDLDLAEFSPGYISGYSFVPSQHRAMIDMLTVTKSGLETVTGGWREDILKFIEEGMKKQYVSYDISAEELSRERTAIVARGNIDSGNYVGGVVILGEFSANDFKKYKKYSKVIWVTEKILNSGRKETMRCISQACGFGIETTPLTLVRKWKTKLITKAEYEKFSEGRTPFSQDEKKQFIDNTDMEGKVLYVAVCDETGEFVCAATLTIEDDTMIVFGLVVRDGMSRGTVFAEKIAYEVIQQKVNNCTDEYSIMLPMAMNLYLTDGYSEIWNPMIIDGMPVRITGGFGVIVTDYGSLKEGMYGGLGPDSYDDVRNDVIKYIECVVGKFNSKSAESKESITTEMDVNVIPYSKYSADVRLVMKETGYGVLESLDILFAYDTPNEYFIMNERSIDEDYEMDNVMTISREMWTQARKTVERTLLNRIGICDSYVHYSVLSDYKFETISCDIFDNMADGYLEEELNEYDNPKYYKVSDKSGNIYCIMEVGYNEGSTLIAHNIAFMSEKYDDSMYTVMTVLSDIYDSLIETEKRTYRHIKKIAVEYDAGIYGSDTAFLHGGFNKSLKNHEEGRRTLRYSIDIKKFKKLQKDKELLEDEDEYIE